MVASAAVVSEAQRAEYAADGAVLLPGLVAPAWLAALAASADRMKRDGELVDSSGPDGPTGSSGYAVRRWRTDPVIRDYVFTSGIARAAAELTASRQIRVYEDLLVYKEPGATTGTPWHQDEAQWPMTGTQFCSIWISTEAVSDESGALRVVPGSHRGPLYDPTTTNLSSGVDFVADGITGGPFPDVDASGWPVKRFSAQPGDAIAFHPRLLHSAGGTSETAHRRTFSVRFVGDDVRYRWKSCIFLEDMRGLELRDGDPLEHELFPLIP